jgi:hypothetical protein
LYFIIQGRRRRKGKIDSQKDKKKLGGEREEENFLNKGIYYHTS